MGCDYYNVTARDANDDWVEVSIKFSEARDDVTCLCSLFSGVESTDVRSMAMLGAVLALGHQGKLDVRDGYLLIPQDVPDNVMRMIDAVIPK